MLLWLHLGGRGPRENPCTKDFGRSGKPIWQTSLFNEQKEKKRKEGGDLWENAEIQTGTTQRIKAK